MTPPADGAILGATIRTLDPDRPLASAAAWRDGMLIAVGDDPEVREHVGRTTDVLDGAGTTVVPGLVDTHIHPFHGTEATRGVDLRAARTLDDVRGLLAAERARCGPDTWILAHSVRYEPFHESGIRADLIADAIGESPAILGFYDGHTALATAPALALAGVDGPREFTEFAEVVCDPDGRPTGALLENGAMDLVRAAVPAWTEAERLDAFAATFRAFNAAGLTGVQAMLGDPALLDACRELEARGELTARLLVPMHLDPGVGEDTIEAMLAHVDVRGRLWRTGTAKFFLDGVLDSGTAWLVDPGPGGVNAAPFWPDLDRYRDLVDRFTAAGFSCITHAVGDGAVRGALDAYEAAGPPARGMHRIEHIETLVDSDLPRFAGLGVAAGMQPLHMEGLDEPDVPSSWVDGLSEGRYERRFPRRRPGRVGRGGGARIGLDGRGLRPARGHGVGDAAAQAGRAGPRALPARAGARRGDGAERLHRRRRRRGRHRAQRGPGGRGPGGRPHGARRRPARRHPRRTPAVPIAATVVDGRVVFRGEGG